jgi:phage terminase small subunit
MNEEQKLTEKQKRFIEEFMIDSNATAAYVRAGYSPKLANTHASKLLRNATIYAEIKRRQEITSKKLEITREGILSGAQKLIEVYDKLAELAIKPELTDIERDQYKRLMMVLRASDANKAREILLKANGWETPTNDTDNEKIESISIKIIRKSDDEK